MNELWVCNLATIEYREALALQESVRDARQAGAIPDVLLQLEHLPVYTRGRRSGAQDFPFPREFYTERGVDIVETNRGGKITYHGPGQLVGYPIIAVDDVVAYVRLLERAMVATLAETGITAADRASEGPDYTGVWVDGARKIASIGVHVSRGITTHGYAVNVENSLEPFTWVVACGLPDVAMTSVQAELERAGPGRPAPSPGSDLACFRKRMSFALAQQLGARQRLVTLERLQQALGAVTT